MSEPFKPKIIVFCCNWCAYAGADLAGISRFQISPHFRVIRTYCSARVDPEFILYAFKRGADGVLILGHVTQDQISQDQMAERLELQPEVVTELAGPTRQQYDRLHVSVPHRAPQAFRQALR